MTNLHVLSEQGIVRVMGGDVAGLFDVLQAASDVTVPDRDYAEVIDALKRACQFLDDPRSLATLAWLQPNSARRWIEDAAKLPPQDIARLHLLNDEQALAAAAFEQAGWLAHAAVCRERAGDLDSARSCWLRLSHRLASPTTAEDASGRDAAASAERLYVLGLVRYNVARTSEHRQAAERRDVVVGAVSALGEAAQGFEVVGLRERAFDCYEALAAIGTTTRVLEHVLEGRVNAIRILREDHLDQYALTQYQEVIEETTTAGELTAAAGFARDAWAFARSIERVQEARAFVSQAIDLHAAQARKLLRGERVDADGSSTATRSAPVQLAEGLFRTAIALSAQVGMLGRARALYQELAGLSELTPARRARHLEAARKLEGVTDSEASTVRSRMANAPALEVWIVDVLEWERGGRAEEVAGEILLETLRPSKARSDSASILVQRRALVCRLLALQGDTSAARRLLAQKLGTLLDYRVLAVLEQLVRHPAKEVRAAAVEASEGLPFKRSAQLLRVAARDAEKVVLDAVERVVAHKRSAVFVDPLRRLSREAATASIRIAALRTLCFIEVAEAAEAVLDVVVAGTPAERSAVVETLGRRRLDPQGPLIRAIRTRLSRGLDEVVARELSALLPPGS